MPVSPAPRGTPQQGAKDAMLQANLEAVVGLLKTSEAANDLLRTALSHADAERVALVSVLLASLSDAEAQASAAQAAGGLSETGLRSLAEELRNERDAAVQAAELARAAQRSEAAAASAAAERAVAAEAAAEEERRAAGEAAERASAAEARAESEAAAAAQARREAEAAVAAAADARAVLDACQREHAEGMAAAAAAAEKAREEGEAVATEALRVERARAGQAEKGAEAAREEMKRAVGVERQRVASLMYKEALHFHTIDEQSRQLEALSSQLAAAQAARAQADAARAQLAGMEDRLRAMADSRARDMAKILSLDEMLGDEQQARKDQSASIAALQQALTARVARETAAADRATKAEADYAALREQFRHLRMQLAAAARDLDARQEADAQTGALKRAESFSRPVASVQTDFISMIVPLPNPARVASR